MSDFKKTMETLKGFETSEELLLAYYEAKTGKELDLGEFHGAAELEKGCHLLDEKIKENK